MPDRLISEPLVPRTETSDTSRMAVGEPGLPQEFLWREEAIHITSVIRTWKDTRRCTHGSTDRYVRRHWYEVATAGHGRLKIYFDRHPRPHKGRKEPRWWLFSMVGPEENVLDGERAT